MLSSATGDPLASGGQMHPAHFATRTDRAMSKALYTVGEADDLDLVVDPDVRRVGDDQVRRLLINRGTILLLDQGSGLAQQGVDFRVGVPARRFPGAVKAAVIHLADPVVGI